MGSTTSSAQPTSTPQSSKIGTQSDESLKLYQEYYHDSLKSNKVVIFSQSSCYYCTKAKELFSKLNTTYKLIELDVNSNCPENNCKPLRNFLVQKTGMKTVPQIFINGRLIGGYSELVQLYEAGKLKSILK